MAEQQPLQGPTAGPHASEQHLAYLKLSFIAAPYAELAHQAAHQAWSHVDYLAPRVEGEAAGRRDRAPHRRLRLARFPVIKTLEQFRWDWPTRMNRLQVQHHCRLTFIQDKVNLIFLGGVGLGKPQPEYYPSRSQCFTGPYHLCR
jgi:DNA replication protein DnaC